MIFDRRFTAAVARNEGNRFPATFAVIIKWQNGEYGGFYSALIAAICHADPGNAALLSIPYPVEVAAVKGYQNGDLCQRLEAAQADWLAENPAPLARVKGRTVRPCRACDKVVMFLHQIGKADAKPNPIDTEPHAGGNIVPDQDQLTYRFASPEEMADPAVPKSLADKKTVATHNHTVCGRTQFISRKRKTRLIPNLPAGEGMVEPCPKCEYIYNTGGQNAKR